MVPPEQVDDDGFVGFAPSALDAATANDVNISRTARLRSFLISSALPHRLRVSGYVQSRARHRLFTNVNASVLPSAYLHPAKSPSGTIPGDDLRTGARSTART